MMTVFAQTCIMIVSIALYKKLGIYKRIKSEDDITIRIYSIQEKRVFY
jgi:hypothetical protein